MDPETDAALYARIREGDRQAFAALVARHQDALLNYLTRVTGDRAWAEDLTQETFLRLYRHRERYPELDRLRGFLFRVATNLAVSELRRRQRREALRRLWPAGNGHGAEAPDTPQDEVLRREAHRELAAAIARLPVRYRVALVLREVEGLSCAAVAEVLGCRVGTVKSRVHRGRQRLKRALAPYLVEGKPLEQRRRGPDIAGGAS